MRTELPHRQRCPHPVCLRQPTLSQGERVLRARPDQILSRWERVVSEGEPGEGGADPTVGAVSANPHAAASVALSVIIAISRSSVASARAISPVTRPSRMVTMRSLTVSTSGSSEEMAITAMPDRAMS